MSTKVILSKQDLLAHWLGHRALTRRIIEAFPEKDLFGFTIGGMRSFAEIAKELISIAAPGLKEIVSGEKGSYDHNIALHTKAEILEKWDQDTPIIETLFHQIQEDRFPENFNLFGEYNFPIIHNILYFIDNEIHHRGQGYVYLRSLGIDPPYFWER